MRSAVIACALLAAAAAEARAGARCADLPRAHVALGADLGVAFGYDAASVRLEDYGYDVGWLMKGVRVAAVLRPVSCIEIGAVARRWQTTEGTSSSGARFTSQGDVAAGSIGFRVPTDGIVGVGMSFEVGAMRGVQHLRGATVTGWSPTIGGRTEVTLGRGAAKVVLAFETTAYFDTDDYGAGIAPSLDAFALHVGVLQRL